MNKCYGLRYSLDNDQEWSVTTEGESGTSKESLYPEVPLEELSDFLLVLTSTCCALAAEPECDISSRDFSVSRLFSIFWEYRSRSRKFWSRKKVSVSVSKIFSLEKKSRYRSRKYLVSKKSLGIGLENFGLKKSLGIGLENFGLKKSLSNDLKKFVLENFGLQKLWTW